MDRRSARAHAMKLVYEWVMGGDGGEDTKLTLLEINPEENEHSYIEEMVAGVKDNADKIDELIQKYAIGWSISRLSKVDLSILRLAIYELMLKREPGGVVINEAVTLADTYSTEKAGGFVNGVLGSILRSEEL